MMRQLLLEAAGNLLAARQRSLLALLGILVGAGAVIAMLNVGAIAREETVRQFRQMGTDIVTIRSLGAEGGFQLADLQALPAEVPGVREVAPLVISGGMVGFAGTAQNASFLGVTGAFAEVARLRLREGRFLSDLDRYEPFVVLGNRLAAQLSTPFEQIGPGSAIRVGRTVFTVIGVLEPTLYSPMMPVDADGTLFLSIPNARRAMPQAGLGLAVARLAPEADADAVGAALQRHLGPKLRDGGVHVQSARQLIAGMASQMRLFTLLLGAVGSIALVLGGVGVMNIMLVSIAERRREIGIRLAIGALPREIWMLFLAEAVILSVVGGVLGIGLGMAGSWGFAWLSGWNFHVSPSAAPLGAGVSAAVGIFFGFYPALMASRLDPIAALRSE